VPRRLRPRRRARLLSARLSQATLLTALTCLLSLAPGSGSDAAAARGPSAAKCGSIKIVSADQQKLLRDRALKLKVRRCGRARSVALRAFARTEGGGRQKIVPEANRRLGGPTERVWLELSKAGRRALAACDAQRLVVRGRFAGARHKRVRARKALELGGVCGPRDGRPNVLLIITDDQRLDGSMAVMPSTWHEFGDRGTQFDNAYVTTPLCCPSRASIFSGKYPHNHGVRTNGGRGFDPSETWQRQLHDAGYFTGLFGKYFVEVTATQAPYWDRAANTPAVDPNDGAWLAGQADSFLAQAEDDDARPWALVLATTNPHGPWDGRPQTFRPLPPWQPPPSFQEQDLSDKNPAVSAEAARFVPRGDGWPIEVRDGQRTELEQADEMVTSVMGTLDRLDERRDTLAIFVSDNGYLWGEHGLYHKLWPYLESVRVPMMMSWPGHVAEGAHDTRIVANIDLAPTIMQAAGVTPGYRPDGRSLFSSYDRPWLLLEGPLDPLDHVPDWTSLVDEHQQYIEWGDGFVEHYSLDADPYELQAQNAPDPQLSARLAAAAACAGSDCP
jgi:arylsulfatase A-like enzyme